MMPRLIASPVQSGAEGSAGDEAENDVIETRNLATRGEHEWQGPTI